MFIASVLLTLSGVFIFLFLFWNRQKEDFSSDIIFKLATHILVGVGIGGLVSIYFLIDYWLWLAFLGGLIGLLTAIYRLRTKFHEIFEAYVISGLPWLSGVFLFHSAGNRSLSSFLGFLIILIIIFVSYWFDAHYKNFSWYKSGRIGFTGLAVLSIIFAIRVGLAIMGASVLSFVGKFEQILSGIGFLASIILLIHLGRTEK